MARPALTLSLQFARDDLPRTHRAQLPRHRVARWIRAALDAPAEITVRVVGTDEARTLNRDFRGQDHATNVLTFDYSHAPTVHADLVLCADVVEAEARAQSRTLEAHYAHLLIHGTLHAQGHDHERDDEAEVMEARESELMRALGFADPYSS
ncbi:MAG: rRNA maturation RNase YbeY [Burkholderiaceae bacterium]|nr:rRNA maturation RNase YbeY [Burkholderiaceae bacterium]